MRLAKVEARQNSRFRFRDGRRIEQVLAQAFFARR
jgi:hypothetical protein